MGKLLQEELFSSKTNRSKWISLTFISAIYLHSEFHHSYSSRRVINRVVKKERHLSFVTLHLWTITTQPKTWVSFRFYISYAAAATRLRTVLAAKIPILPSAHLLQINVSIVSAWYPLTKIRRRFNCRLDSEARHRFWTYMDSGLNSITHDLAIVDIQ